MIPLLLEAHSLENVHRRVTMQVPGIKDLDYEDRLQELNLPTLFYQCLCGDMIEVYELTLGLYDP